MTTQEIEILIDACKNAGVSHFKFKGLDFQFFPREEIAVAPARAYPSQADRAIELELEEDDDLREIALQNLLIENPLAYEAAVRSKANGAYGSRSE
jgi:hypothetical protein